MPSPSSSFVSGGPLFENARLDLAGNYFSIQSIYVSFLWLP